MPEYTVQRLLDRYAIVWKEDGKRRRIRLNATDRAGAEAEARKRWQGDSDGPWTVGRVMRAYLEKGREAGIASSDRQDDAWKAMRHFWDRIDPSLIDEPMAKEYARQRNRADATVRYELSMLSVALRWAKNTGKIDTAPEVWRPSAPERKRRHLTRSQFAKWYREVKAPHARLYVILGLATMARPSAILELTWPQIDWEHETVDLNPPGRRQTKKHRPVVPLHAEAMDALREAYAGRQCEYVIERGAKRIKSMKKAFQAASERSGIKVTPYMLRHTGAVWAAEGGVPMSMLAQFMGHDDDSTTQKHYARFTPDFLRVVSNKVQLVPA